MTPQHVMKMTKALADPTRLRIVQAIATAPERCCGDLARDVSITQATLSQHLKVLTDAGLVEPGGKGNLPTTACGGTSSTRTNTPWRRRCRGRPRCAPRIRGAGHTPYAVCSFIRYRAL
jgi:ArsR family transcriptional regulator, arsenate/arsenite/antimonite-responsive transcriptional repressor